jgi:hypothetical protein
VEESGDCADGGEVRVADGKVSTAARAGDTGVGRRRWKACGWLTDRRSERGSRVLVLWVSRVVLALYTRKVCEGGNGPTSRIKTSVEVQLRAHTIMTIRCLCTQFSRTPYTSNIST